MAIYRENFTPSKHSVVCSAHFCEDVILREGLHLENYELEVKRRVRLQKGAVPTIFPGQPSYLTLKTPVKRMGVERRLKIIEERDAQNLDEFINNDKIIDFESFKENCRANCDSKWMISECKDNVFFGRLVHEHNMIPHFLISFKVHSNLNISVYLKDVLVNNSKFDFILGDSMLCDKWSKFQNLLSHLYNYEDGSAVSSDKLALAFQMLDEVMEEKLGENYVNYVRLKEQILLLGNNRKRYSADFMLFSCTLYYSNPAAYKFMRENSFLTLPSADYIRKLALTSNIDVPGLKDSHINYLKQRLCGMTEDEKMVNVLLDEIHVKPSYQYKGGKIKGVSENNVGLANCVQTFMISSLRSSHKDVVALFPVTKLTSADLLNYTHVVLKTLHEIGFNVISLISDNNRVNRNMFESFCGGTLKCCIDNPYDLDNKLFFLFDSVHLIKCIRNNWLNDKLQTFKVPSFENLNSFQSASLKPIKDMYISESNKIVKLAPSLSQKVLFPSSFDRQNVQFALNLFNEKVISALQTTSSSNKALVEFMAVILKWWNVVNVKTISKGHVKRLPEAKPITSANCPNIDFLNQFLSWVEVWSANCKRSFHPGMLTTETYFALHHTTKTLIEVSKYLLRSKNYNFILLGKFQTDNLKRRFGLYRRMSGCNYHVSVTQVLESEKKIKIINYLKLKNSSVNFKLSNLSAECELSENLPVSNFDFPDIFENLNSSNIDSNDANVLVYIAGYVAHAVNKKVKCQYCSFYLHQDRDLNFEISESSSEYLNLLDRGGLKMPTCDLSTICTNTFLLFSNIISMHENEFCHCVNQKNALVNCSFKYHSEMYKDESCICKRPLMKLVLLSIKVMSNILLNNYTKIQNNFHQRNSNKKRKLSTLNS